MKKQWTIIFFLVLTSVSLLLHFPHLKKDLISIHVWRQTQTQTNINNFYEEDFNILNPRKNERADGNGIFRMEFPLMQWSVAGLYKIFGSSILLTRIFMFITGLLSILGMFFFIKTIFKNDLAAIIGAWALCFSPSFYYYTINPLPDNFALAVSIWGAYFVFKWIQNTKLFNFIIGSFLLSVAALCKLPFILYWVIIPVYILSSIFRKERKLNNFVSEIIIGFSFLLMPAIWYTQVISGWEGNGIVTGMLDNTKSWSTIFDYIQHNLISVLPELLVNYAALPLFILGIVNIFQKKIYKRNNFLIYAFWGISILAYFFFEINMIAKIHDYYLFPFYPLIILLIVYGAINLINSRKKIYKYLTFILLLALPFTAYIRMHIRWDENEPGFNKDLLIYKKELQNAVPDKSLCIVGNDISHHIFFYYIDKKGWCFEEDQISPDQIQSMINQGAEYLYTDSEIINNNQSFSVLFEEKVGQYGSISIWKLIK